MRYVEQGQGQMWAEGGMTRIEDVARLKELVGRRNAIIEREGDPRTPNYAILERMEIERDMRGATPWLLAVAGQFRAGDSEILRYIMASLPGMDCRKFLQVMDCLSRMLAAARIMEGSKGEFQKNKD